MVVWGRERIVEGTVYDFRAHTLKEKAFRRMKQHNFIRQKHRIMKEVAHDFYRKIKRRR